MANLTFEQARHLVVRTGYGPELERIYRYQKMNRQQAVEDILKSSTNFLIEPPKLTSYKIFQQLTKTKNQKEKGKLFRKDSHKLKQWGLKQLLNNPNTLQEKMTWFWHNHFTSSNLKSRRTLQLMLNQDMTIRQNAIGNFATLLHDLSYDPMMLIYLDGTSNTKNKPNENFARELLELFTLGEGHYSEIDVKEIARAFTGWGINIKKYQATLRRKKVDTGTKTIFGLTGNFSSDDVINMLIQHPRTSEFIAEKFWKEFINLEKPNTVTISSWAKQFTDSNYDISTLIRAVLTSREFWDINNRAGLIKSPLDLVIGSIRSLDLEDKKLPLRSLTRDLKAMGQDIYTPPNVKGWPGGELWIDDVTLPVRQQFLSKLIRGSENQQATMQNMNMKKNLMPSTDIPSISPQQWKIWLLPTPSITPVNQKSPRQKLEGILLDPAYQLK